MPKLIIKKGDFIVKKLSVPDDILAFTVGSEQGNDIIINENSVSFFHVQFERQTNSYYVRDLQSETGTYLNGRKIRSRTVLASNDEIGIGNHAITFMDSELTPDPQPTVSEPITLKSSRFSPNRINHSRLEEQIAGIPSLNQLNSWLDEDQPEEDTRSQEVEDIPQVPMRAAAEPPLAEPAMPEILTDPDSFMLPDSNGKQDYTEQPVFPSTLPDSDNGKLADIPAAEPDLSDEKLQKDDDVTGAYKDAGSETDLFDKTIYYLLCIYGFYTGRKFRVKKGITRIGRDKKLNDLIIQKNSKGILDRSVSRRHASIRYKNNRYFVMDKRSKTRTWLNKQRIDPDDKALLHPGDEIEIISDTKNHIFRFVEEGDWDFTFPKRAGKWHIRNRLKLLNTLSVIICALAVVLCFNALSR
jgi:pSer/pThr/pTyr-binding forkhead associated (FHA) protein